MSSPQEPHHAPGLRPLWSTSPDEFLAWLATENERPFRRRQIEDWIWHRRASSFDEMTDLPLRLRARLTQHWTLWTTHVAHHQRADDGTEKLLIELADAHRIEAVLLRDGDRRTVCISSQVGCAMGCVFCASGLDGVIRNLSAGEIIEQLLHLNRLLPPLERLSHIVVMGMGEPLANLDHLLEALAWASDRRGLGISARRITISSVGLPAGIRRLAQAAVPYHLALSLHAPDDETRNHIVPVNRNITLAAILAAADDYFARTGRRLTYEYVLLAGINDQPQHARRLARLLRDHRGLINLIPYNPVAGLGYHTPPRAAVAAFVAELEAAGHTVQVRERKGDRIDAACGQLRRLRTPQSMDPLLVDSHSVPAQPSDPPPLSAAATTAPLTPTIEPPLTQNSPNPAQSAEPQPATRG